jgi:hypothetical protein
MFFRSLQQIFGMDEFIPRPSGEFIFSPAEMMLTAELMHKEYLFYILGRLQKTST